MYNSERHSSELANILRKNIKNGNLSIKKKSASKNKPALRKWELNRIHTNDNMPFSSNIYSNKDKENLLNGPGKISFLDGTT